MLAIPESSEEEEMATGFTDTQKANLTVMMAMAFAVAFAQQVGRAQTVTLAPAAKEEPVMSKPREYLGGSNYVDLEGRS